MALENNGDFLLRIEDIDQSRARPEWEAQIYDDLKWLGIWWPEPVMRQSERLAAYYAALDELWGQGLLYPCSCSRRDVLNAISAPQEGVPTHGPDGLIYPGTCRDTKPNLGRGPRPSDVTLRLDMRRAVTGCPNLFLSEVEAESVARFEERGRGPQGEQGSISFTQDHLIKAVGDIVLVRRDMGTSYHLSVVIDDHFQDVNCVVRGQDLFEATQIHVLLQELLELNQPIYHHHKLIRDDAGKRLAKRDDARAISLYRGEGATPEDIRRMVGL